MEAEEFFRQYAERSGVSVEQLREWGQEVFPCDCDWKWCKGWQIVNKELYYNDLRVIGDTDA